MDDNIIKILQNVASPDCVWDAYECIIEQLAPSNLLDAVKRIDSGCNSDSRCKSAHSWMPVGISLWAYILNDEYRGNLSKGMSVLELGSGSGSSALIWSNLGYPVTGIELNTDLADYSVNALQKEAHIQNANISIINGSYYPKDFIEYMNTNRDKRVRNIEYREFCKWEPAYIYNTHFPVCDEDTYKKNNISIKDFDIIYAYLWPYQFPSVYNLFKKNARDDALFFAIGPNFELIADKLDLKTHYNSHIVRK